MRGFSRVVWVLIVAAVFTAARAAHAEIVSGDRHLSSSAQESAQDLRADRTAWRRGAMWADAALLPSDVDLYVRLIDGRRLRRVLSDRSFGEAMHALIGDGALSSTWEALARSVGNDPVQLFDQVAGRALTVAARREGEGSWDWVVLAAIEPSVRRNLLRGLHPQRRVGVAGFEVSAVPEHRLRMAVDGDRFVIGPDRAGGLFAQTLQRMAAPEVSDGALASDEVLAHAVRRLGPGQLVVTYRHAQPLGGWSAIALRTDGTRMSVHHRARFDASPFSEPPAEGGLDTSVLTAFEAHFPLAMLSPAQSGFVGDELTRFITGTPLLSPALKAQSGPRRIVCFGERDARDLGGEGDLLRPTISVAIESVGEGADEDDLDRQLERIARRLLQIGRPDHLRFDPDAPLTVTRGEDPEDRHVDLSSVDAVIADAFPLLERMSLNWAVAEGPHGRFWVIATDPRHLRDTVRALEQPKTESPASDPDEASIMAGCGHFHGPRVAEHVRSWAGDAARLAPDEPGAAAQLERTLHTIALLASGVERGRWKLRRPSELEMVLCVELELLPPVSSRR